MHNGQNDFRAYLRAGWVPTAIRRATGYVPPDPVVVDAIYSFEDGGVNLAHDRSSRWPANGSGKNCLERYREAKMLRSCYQGFWGLHQDGGTR